jgi:hypothetical protein
LSGEGEAATDRCRRWRSRVRPRSATGFATIPDRVLAATKFNVEKSENGRAFTAGTIGELGEFGGERCPDMTEVYCDSVSIRRSNGGRGQRILCLHTSNKSATSDRNDSGSSSRMVSLRGAVGSNESRSTHRSSCTRSSIYTAQHSTRSIVSAGLGTPIARRFWAQKEGSHKSKEKLKKER